MSRPTKEESIYKVSIHKNGGYMYAATHPYTVDENGNRKYVYCHWGVVDEDKKFIPGKRYVFASLEERAKRNCSVKSVIAVSKRLCNFAARPIAH